jgi:uncharacterized protein (DUF2126 family)/transglutaminase-like putative cysteine protease
MPIRVALNHKTIYRYDRLVSLTPQVVRLRPAPHCRTPILSYSLNVRPAEHFLNWQQDPYSNYLARLVFPKPTRELSIEVDLTAETTVINPFDFFVEDYAERYPFTYEGELAKELIPYLARLPAGARFRALVDDVRVDKHRTVDYLVELNARLQRDIRYIIRMEAGIQTCEETLEKKSGSCRDSAWLLVQLLRHLGLAARFASGYLIQLLPDVKPLEGPAGASHDFTDLHAWAEVYIPGAGWIGLDPTSGLLAGEGHIPLACAADPVNAAPITGALSPAESGGPEDECGTDFSFTMKVTRLHETPRVTKPYSEEQWQEIDALGHRIDGDLQRDDVRLTMGGEPTFVSIDDMDGPEWTVAALGPAKRRLAGTLLRRLRERFAPGGLLHFAQGKWYPGESLPRWALRCYWRADGVPLWNNPKLIADEGCDYGYDSAVARRFLHELAGGLGVDATCAVGAYEDAWYYLWRERRLPTNVDPLQSRLKDPEERGRLARIFEQGLDRLVGYALPLERRRMSPKQWVTGRWYFRPEHMFLMPGDSPMGLRLPLDSLPWVAPEKTGLFVQQDPFAERGPLPPRIRGAGAAPSAGVYRSEQRFEITGNIPPTAGPHEQILTNGQNGNGKAATDLISTALCVEPREGRLYIFLPPQRDAEDFVDLVAAIEDTAASLHMPVVLEGYPPPHDHRLNHFSVTPDPGVIEVNIHPAHSWEELVHNTTVLYEEARQSRLGTEKFMLDGRHTGTGGGNHVVIGGPAPADSPILRRPDLLRSLLAYWNNHPALSYLFSSLFVGPTSQAPRVDEARSDSLYELEIAFRQIPDQGEAQVLPWLVDRVFRHLLVDVTGNTHRTEFCMDKLYAPEASEGRRGLLEMRAFEMPPDAHMSLVQQLLLRALIARFWKNPYRERLVRWGTELHDRFLLPHFVDQDFRDVIFELNQAGFPLRAAWFVPHFEFRFPQIGTVAYREIELELRTAIEPWHVLGEEPGAGGTVRYVDSSVERLQVLVRNMTDSRHLVTCNGRRVPLTATGTNGEFVAGARYRAWQPPSCLHPTVGVQAPLVFDLVDTWQGRSVGGCKYHVAHPGGRSYQQFPVNAFEAESRRCARFFRFGHTPGPVTVPPQEILPEAPFTLDLRESNGAAHGGARERLADSEGLCHYDASEGPACASNS